jgi:hypothetical protein
MPRSAVAMVCVLLVGAGAVLATRAVALAADGSYQLLRVIAESDVNGSGSRVLALWAHQGAAVLAVRGGVTNTYVLAVLLGVGQLVLPAVVWSLAVVLSRPDGLECAAVAMLAGLNAATTWFFSVGEVVIAAPLTVLVAVLLRRQDAWRLREAVLAIVAAGMLVASYETAVATGVVLAVWSAWRVVRARGWVERTGCGVVAGLSALSIPVALSGTRAGPNPTSSQSFLYFLVSLEPWPFYVGLLGVTLAIASLGPWLSGVGRATVAGLALMTLVVATVELDPDPVTAFEGRAGAAVGAFLLELFLLARWIADRETHPASPGSPTSKRSQLVTAAVPVVFVAAMIGTLVQPSASWSRSLSAFRTEVNGAHGIVEADVLPADRRAVLWGWTASSLSLLVRGDPGAGVLVDSHPSFVPFAPAHARTQIPAEYTWRR